MELICFDLDNTLVRTNKTHILAFKKAFKKNKLQRKTTKEILNIFSLESSVIVHKLYPDLPSDKIKIVVKDHDQYLFRETAKYIKPIKGAETTLNELKTKYKIVLLSNCKHKEILTILRYAKIKKSLFDLIIGNNEVKRPKPAPDEIIKAKSLLRIKKGYMVGDSTYDIRAGKKAGLKTIAVLTGNHTRKQLQKEKPWKILKDINSLQETL